MDNMSNNRNKEITKEDAYTLCQKYLGGIWLDADLKDFVFIPVRGGLSNMLYRCSLSENTCYSKNHDDATPKEILLRIYGIQQERLESIVQEAAVFTLLSERRLGPKLYGIFQHGRLEEYVPSRTLTRDDMKILSREIAVELAKIHSLQVPIPKQPTTITSYTWNWIECLEKVADNPDSPVRLPEIVDNRTLRKEFEWLIEQMSNTCSPIMFSHNDLTGGNILLLENKQRTDTGIMIIDFEFGCYNYRGYDIAAHFCLRCFTYDEKTHPKCHVDLKYYPGEEEQLVFIEAYLAELQRNGAFQGTASELEQEKLKILEEVKIFRLTSSLVCCIWALNASLTSTIEFDYMDYATIEWEIYRVHKKELQVKQL